MNYTLSNLSYQEEKRRAKISRRRQHELAMCRRKGREKIGSSSGRRRVLIDGEGAAQEVKVSTSEANFSATADCGTFVISAQFGVLEEVLSVQ